MYIYGKNACMEALKNNQKIMKAYIYENFSDKNLISAIQNLNIDIKFCTKKDLFKFEIENHQGIILSVPDYEYKEINEVIDDSSFLVMLDHIEDPHNLGAIIRTCEAAGVDSIIIPKDRCANINGTVVKVSAGALANIPVCQVTNLANAIQKLKNQGFWIVGTAMDGDDYSTIDYKGKICIVIGNEGSGISPLIRKECDFIASIPMEGKINSLNASVATGIVVFEALKQRIK